MLCMFKNLFAISTNKRIAKRFAAKPKIAHFGHFQQCQIMMRRRIMMTRVAMVAILLD